MKQFIALSRKGTTVFCGNMLIGLLLIAFGLVGCGGKLGKIESSAVDTAIADAAAAVLAAQEVDAPSLAAEAFAAAESNLEAAKVALTEKEGNAALRLAYQATADARVAYRDAVNIAKNAELNAALLQKEVGVDELREKLSAKERKLAEAQTEIQDMHLSGRSSNEPSLNLIKRIVSW